MGGMAAVLQQQAAPPVLCQASAQALQAWVFCAGWVPERWVLYGALHDVDDWALLIELMADIRSLLNTADES